jgi:hypothetical protein
LTVTGRRGTITAIEIEDEIEDAADGTSAASFAPAPLSCSAGLLRRDCY